MKKNIQKKMQTRECLLFDCQKYRIYPCDFQNPDIAAHTQLGWTNYQLKVPKSETALILMHLWNWGYPGGLEWSQNSSRLGHAQCCEWVGRCKQCYDEKIPAILDAARKAGVTVIHVASDGESYAGKYQQYQKTKSEVPEPSISVVPGAIKRPDIDWFPDDLTSGPNFKRDREGIVRDFPSHLRPEGNDIVVVTTHQLNIILRNRKIWHLNYCGFAINVCLWYSPCGMLDMKRLGYACGCIKQGTVAVENNISAVNQGNHAYAMWWTSHYYGWVMDDKDFIYACRNPVLTEVGLGVKKQSSVSDK